MLSAFTIGPWLVIGVLAFALYRYYRAAKTGNFGKPPVVINPGAAMRLVQAAITGNKDALLMAVVDSVHLDLASGSIEQTIMAYAMDEIQRQLNDPSGKAPVIKAIAHFTGLTDQQVFDILKVELLGPPVAAPSLPPAPATVAAAILLCLCLAGPAAASSPIRAPDRWEAPRQEIQIDPAIFSKPVSIAHRGEILLPDSQYVSLRSELIYPDSQQPVYFTTCGNQQVAYWNNGRWYPGKLIVQGARNVRGWLAHRRFRPLARLFGRG